mgnify:CR=1 FL=1
MPTDAADATVELVDYYECFIRIDVDDDGEAELVRACFAGSDSGKLLDWEVWEDENPFDDIPCEPIPHRWSARSITDETTDVQDVKTVLTRQALNNIYATNNPQRFVTGKIDNMDELLNPTFGGVVTGAIGATVEPLAVPFVANHAFEAMAQQDEVIQRRTIRCRSAVSVTRLNSMYSCRMRRRRSSCSGPQSPSSAACREPTASSTITHARGMGLFYDGHGRVPRSPRPPGVHRLRGGARRAGRLRPRASAGAGSAGG